MWRRAPPAASLPGGLTFDLDPSLFADSFDRLEVQRPLGAGGVSELFVCAGRSSRGVEELTLKRMRGQLRDQPEILAMFANEAEKLARLSHPRLPRLRGHVVHQGLAYLVYDYIPGQPLTVEVDGLTWTAPLFHRLEEDLGLILSALWAQSLVHTDLTPKNVVHAPGDRFFLVDFGLCFDARCEAPNLKVRRQESYVPRRDLENPERWPGLDRASASRVLELVRSRCPP